MALIKVAGTASWQKVHLCLSRKPEGKLKEGEYAHTNNAWELKEYRRKLSENSVNGMTINRIQISKFENDNGTAYPVTLYVTYKTRTHLINLGWGGMGKSIVNSLLSFEKMTDEQIANARVDLSFYTDKEGKNKVSIKINGNRWEWAIPKEEKDKLVSTSEFKGKILVDDSKYCELLLERSTALNERLPKANFETGNALDEFFGEDEQASESSIDSDFPDELPVSEVEVPTKKVTTPVAEDISFV